MDKRRYSIIVESALPSHWSDWLGGLEVFPREDGVTVITGAFDQAGLHGLLAKLRDLGITLIAVNRSLDCENPSFEGGKAEAASEGL